MYNMYTAVNYNKIVFILVSGGGKQRRRVNGRTAEARIDLKVGKQLCIRVQL